MIGSPYYGIKQFCLPVVFLLLVFLNLKPAAAQSVVFDWAKSFGGPNPANLWGASITKDAAGNVYTAGNITATADFDPGPGTANLTPVGGVDLFISKLDASGNYVWAYRIGGSGTETAESIVADAAGNLYVTGSFSNTVDFDPGAGTANLTSSGSTDIYILKLNSSGVFQWVQKIGSAGAAGNDYGDGVTLDPSGNVLLTGLFSNTADFDPGAGTTNLTSNGFGDIFVAKFDASGNFIWAKSAGSSGTDVGNAITTNATGKVFITGSFSGTVDFDPGTGTNNLTANTAGCTFILNLNSDGSFGWAGNFSGPLYNEGNSIGVDNNSNVIVAGLFDGTVDFDPGAGVFNQTEAGSDDFFVCKLDASGNFVWAHGFGSVQEDGAEGIAVDASGNCYITGYFASTVDFDPGSGVSNLSSSPANSYDIYILKLDAAGKFLWAGQMGGLNDLESGESITLDGAGNVYAIGNFYGTADFDPIEGTTNLTAVGSGRNVFIVKLKPIIPTITSFSPGSGPIGTSVTITGTNFSTIPAENIVYFGATKATVTAATTTQLTVTVPFGATFQPISVLVNELTAFSKSPFLVTFPDGGVINACSFDTPVGFGSADGAIGVVLGDLDGDGKTDAAVTDYSNNSIRVFRNTSTAGTIDANSFSASVSFGVGLNPSQVSIADIDGDGKLDLIATSWGGSLISIFRNTSTVGSITSASFATSLDLPTGTFPFNISCQDLDGDGKTDIAAGNAGSGTVSIWQNIGTPGSITAGSFNARLDVAGPSTGFAIADMDLDGKSDLIGGYNLGTTVGVSRNISSPGTLTAGSFAAPVNFTVAAWPEHVIVGDLDADNRPDIVTSSWPGNKISILKNTSTPGTIGAGSFAATVDIDAVDGTTEPRGVYITDFDGDGLPDIGLSNQTSKVSIYKNANTPGVITTASFLPRVNYSPTGNARDLASGDIDGDGKPDLVIASWGSPSLEVLRNRVSSLPPPTGSSYSPTSGPIGTVVTFTGTNFSTTPLNNTVKFNGVTATVAASTSTSITTTVPVGATTGPISVTVGCNTMITVSNFTVTTPPPLSSPTLAWAKEMGANSSDMGLAVTTDAAGNVYNTGYFIGTVDFDSGPDETNLTANGSSDIYVTKFNAAGKLLWAKSMGATPDEKGQGIAVDASGNVYITGYFFNTVDFDPGPGVSNLTSRGVRDVYVCKLDASGNFVWAKSMGGSGLDEGKGIAIDGVGNVLTTGYFNGAGFFDPASGTVTISSSGLTDIFVSKLDASGNFVWAKKMGGTSFDKGNAIAVDASNNVFTTGQFDVTADFDPGAANFPLISNTNSDDIFVSKLDASGNFGWAIQMGGSRDDLGSAITVDGSGNVIATGNFYFDFAGTPIDFDPGAGVVNLTPTAGNNFTLTDIFITKFDGSGNLSWAKQLSGPSSEACYAVDADAAGNVYTTGNFVGTVDFDPGASVNNITSSGSEFFVHKLDPSGSLVWIEHFGTGSNVGNGIAVDGAGNVITTGVIGLTTDFAPGSCVFNLTSNGSDDIFVQKLSQTAITPPNILSFSPASGPSGTVVTITGTNFSTVSSDNIVSFNGLEATVFSSTSTSITTVVPSGAIDGPISVSIVCEGATSASNFDVTGSCNIPATERAALIDLYDATDGDSWTNNTNWLNTDESTWYGITVAGCRVTEIDLSENQLSGNLPATIADLTSLEVLKLYGNALTGPLPGNIGDLTDLTQLQTQNNQMTGTIPASLANCLALENLHLEDNQHTGNIPSFLGDLSNLTSINLGFNQFDGLVPPELGNLNNLTFLSLADNQLYGDIPPELGQLSQLELLDLSRNDFYNPMPPELGDLTSLISLQLWDNGLNGSIPFELGNLTNLQELNLETNLLESSAPTSLQNLTQLRILSLANNEIDLVPDVIGGLPNLESVDISNNRLNTLPVFTSPSLTFLAVQNNRLHFGDMEPNNGVASYITNPQALLPPGGDIFFTSGSTLTIPFTTPGTGNSYQWFKDGVAILGANSATLSIPNASASDIGLYTVHITSSIVNYTVLESVIYTALTDPCPVGPRGSGEIDASFDPLITDASDIGAIGLQSSGKIMASAPGNTINGTPRDGILRFNTDGSLDATFQSIPEYPLTNQMLVQPDDYILTTTGDPYSEVVARYDADGNPDGAFNGPAFYNAYAYALGIQSDGRILVSLSNDGTPMLIRLNVDGNEDASFVQSISTDVTIIRVQSNDKILIDDTNNGGVIRLNADGSLDPSFANTTSTGGITDIAIQSDGKILVTGSFDYFNDVPSRGLVRLNTDGSVDDTFSTIVIYDPDNSTYQGRIGLMADGSIILGGYFSVVEGAIRNSLVRLNSDGSVDCSFDPLLGPDNTINGLTLQPDGKILIAGQFAQYDGTVRNGFARVNNSSVSISIITQPQNPSECLNTSKNITTIATGTTNINYRWQFSTSATGPFADINNGGGYSFVTSTSLTINTTGNFGEGYYRCRINGDLAAEVFSNVVFFDVIVVAPPTANNVTVCAGDPVVLTATGGIDGNYRWLDSDNSLVSGAVNGTFIDDGNNFGPPFQVYLVEGSCRSTKVTVTVTINPCTEPPVIATTEITVAVQGSETLDLLSLLSDPDNDLDLSTLTITQQPSSGAVATLNGTMLSIDYEGISFSGTDNLRIRVCDLGGNCTEQDLSIVVVGSVTVFNALSPGDDGKNDVFLLQYIEILESTKSNHVTIFNRWGDVVWEIKDYNNTTRVFKGLNKNGNELPTGVYFYRVTFSGGERPLEGFISLKR